MAKRRKPAPYQSSEAINTLQGPAISYMPMIVTANRAIVEIKRRYNLGRYAITLLCGFYNNVNPSTVGRIDGQLINRSSTTESVYLALADLVARGYLQKTGERNIGGFIGRASLYTCTVIGRLVAEEYLLMYGKTA